MKSIRLPIPQNPTVQNFNKPEKKKKINSSFKPATMKLTLLVAITPQPSAICTSLETELKL